MADTVKHTPGPWHVDPKAPEESFFEDVSILRHDGLAVAVAVHNGNILPPEPEANACLIAAAPDLLDALKAVYADHTYETPSGYINCRFCDCNTDREGTFRDTHDEDCLIHPVLAAIAKAEGRS